MIDSIGLPTGDGDTVIELVRSQLISGQVRVTQHANEEMIEEEISWGEVVDAIGSGRVLEDYPEHQRGPCCLIYGITRNGRHVHVVCTTANPVLVIITVYEPVPPKWPTPTRRGRST